MNLDAQDVFSIYRALVGNADSEGRELRLDGRHLTPNARIDSGEVAAFARAFTYVMKAVHDIVQAPNKARGFFPPNREVPVGAETYVWHQFATLGDAQLASTFGDDPPMVDVVAKEFTGRIRDIVDAYMFSIQEIERAVFQGVPLQIKKGLAARRMMDNKVEKLASVGDAGANLPGAVNNATVPLIVNPAINGNWGSATAAQILDDLNYIGNYVTTQSSEAFSATQMLLPLVEFQLIMTKPYSTLTPTPVGRVFLDQSPYITDIDSWAPLSTADAAGTGPRIMSYWKDPMAIDMVVVMEFTQYPPQLKGFKTTINCRMSYGGINIYYPGACVYADLAH